MKPESQIKALAELDGWTLSEYGFWHQFLRPEDKEFADEGQLHGATAFYQLPKWTTSYDAIIPLIQKQTKDIQSEFLTILFRWYGNNADPDLDYMTLWPMTFALTPAQLAEALLRATNLWREE